MTASLESALEGAITNSERGAAACPTRWLLGYGFGLRVERPERALTTGTIWHLALDAYWMADAGKRVSAARAALAAVTPPEPASGMFDAFGEAEQRRAALWAADAIARYHAHWSQRGRKWAPVVNEETMVGSLPDKNGKATYRRIAGRLDRAIEDENGQLWIVDHKSSSASLLDWRRENGSSGQGAQYALLLSQKLNRPVVGVIYDLASTAELRRAEDFQRKKNGGLYKLPDGALASCLASEFARAVEASPGGWAGEAWYAEQHRALARAEANGRWFSEVCIRFPEAELARVELELGYEWRRINQFRRDAAGAWDAIRSASPIDRPNVITHEFIHRCGDFPRQPGLCVQYRKPCQFSHFCHSPSAATAAMLSPVPRVHGELFDTDPEDESADV